MDTQSNMPMWLVAATWIGIFVFILRTARAEEFERKRTKQAHTFKDTVLLFFASAVTAACGLAAMWFLSERHTPKGIINILIGGVPFALWAAYSAYRHRKQPRSPVKKRRFNRDQE